jgi:pimeloyl-ACP methyl ester carboxylesterase
MSIHFQATRLSRRQALQWTVAASVGFAAGCTKEEQPATRAATPAPSKPAPLPSGLVDSDGLKIHYETFGAGEPIVLVHGWGSSIKGNWANTGWIEALRPTRRVVALDVRGHGESDKPHDQSAYSYAAMSRDVLAVMDHLGIAKADYLGYSMGSFMGISLLASAPRRFTSMILGGIGDETDDSLAALPKIVAGLRAEDPAQITDPVSAGFRAYADSDPHNDLEALALSALQMWPEGFPLKLAGKRPADVDVPILVVNGANDHPYIDTVHRLIEALPNARLAVVPDCDHLRVVSDPRFKEEVLAFLGSRH